MTEQQKPHSFIVDTGVTVDDKGRAIVKPADTEDVYEQAKNAIVSRVVADLHSRQGWGRCECGDRILAVLRERFPPQPDAIDYDKLAEWVMDKITTYEGMNMRSQLSRDNAKPDILTMLKARLGKPDEKLLREACEAVVVYFYDDCHETCPFCSARKAEITENDCFPHEDDCLFVLAQAALASNAEKPAEGDGG